MLLMLYGPGHFLYFSENIHAGNNEGCCLGGDSTIVLIGYRRKRVHGALCHK